MVKSNVKAYRDQNPEELTATIEGLRAQLFQDKFQVSLGSTRGDAVNIREVKRDLARALTVQRERERQALIAEGAEP